jgi:type I restriction enzyme R subunit
MGMTDDEISFCDAPMTNESAVVAMSDSKLKVIVGKPISTIRKYATIEWKLQVSVRAVTGLLVRRILSGFGHPPEIQ